MNSSFALLVGVVQVLQPKVATVSEQPQELSCILSPVTRRIHEFPRSRGSGLVVHHGLVVNRQKVFVRHPCEGVEPTAGSASRHYAFHVPSFSLALERAGPETARSSEYCLEFDRSRCPNSIKGRETRSTWE
jgi:hypothetical protein